MKHYFTLAIFISSFLLFLIQPMLAKLLLPYVGGAAGIWTVSMLFFQILLLAGYGYATLSSRYFSPLTQSSIHVALYILTCLCYIPLVLKTTHHPLFENLPELWILAALSLSIGLPYFLLSANSSMLQRWYFAAYKEEPYYLFSASNAGSFLGLFAYPFLFEWLYELPTQMLVWSYAFVLLALCLAAFPIYFIRRKHISPALTTERRSIGRLSGKHTGAILFYAFIPSSLFLSTTLFVTTDIASLPLIWIIPLALYLFSFVIVFSPKGERYIKYAQTLHACVLPLYVVTFFLKTYTISLLLHFVFFFIIAVSSHGQLARIRPAPEKLTIYFFWMSVGGALGGMCNLLAPYIFNDVYEYYIVILLSILVLPGKAKLKNYMQHPEGRKRLIFIGVLACIAAVSNLNIWGKPDPSAASELLLKARNFYGISKVLQTDDYRIYIHGNTIHGIQSHDLKNKPLLQGYYPPLETLVNILPESEQHEPLAMVGLGVGTFAAIGKKNQQIDFFEINPDVIAIASDPKYFTYISNSPATVNQILGDGRLELNKKPDHHYAFLAVDAFSSDAIPMHLITLEAIKMYSEKIKPDKGMLVFHVTNRHLTLIPFLNRIAETMGWQGYSLHTENDLEHFKFRSIWFVMVPAKSPLKQDLLKIGFVPVQPDHHVSVWTDAYSNILPALHW